MHKVSDCNALRMGKNRKQRKRSRSVIDKIQSAPNNLPQDAPITWFGVHLTLAPVSVPARGYQLNIRLTGDPFGQLKASANSGTFLKVPSTLQRAGE